MLRFYLAAAMRNWLNLSLRFVTSLCVAASCATACGEDLLKPLPPTDAVAPASYAAEWIERVSAAEGWFGSEEAGSVSTRPGFQVTLYGAFWADMIFATQRTNPGAFTLFVFSEQDGSENSFELDARRTRLGFDVSGPDLLGAASRGKAEIDFHGEFITQNRATVLLRQAYWEVRNEDYRLLVGQTWDVVAPRLPSTINYSTGFLAGNIGYRRAQFRVERYLQPSERVGLELQGSLNQNIIPDFQADPDVRREATGAPVVMGRVGLLLGPCADANRQLQFGISGHIGESGFDFLDPGPPPQNLPPQDNVRIQTWSFNVDWRVPFGDRWGMHGEFFTGSNLSNELGGIGQGVCVCTRTAVRATGGWGEFWYDWTPWLHSHVGYSIDDPVNRDLQFGRTNNQVIYANLLCDVTSNLITGIEVSYWRTLYQDRRVGQIPPEDLAPTAPGRAVTLDWMVKYEF